MVEKNIPNKPVRRVRKKVEPVVPNKKVKQGSKAGGKGLLIGMGLFIFFIIFLIFIFFFYLTAHPNSAKSIGISTSTIKSITSIFAGLVFGTLFIIFLILGLSYVYKLSTQSTNKTKNLIGTIVIFILGSINLVFGAWVYMRIANIKTDDRVNTNDILIANINFMNSKGVEVLKPMYDNSFPLIGPIKISFQLNTALYRNVEKPGLIRSHGKIFEKRFILDCGNGQTLEYTPNVNLKFPQSKYCLYLNKGIYNAKLKLVYVTANQPNQEQYYTFPMKTIKVDTYIKIKSKYKLNDAKNTIILGERGDEILLDLRKIPEDLGLKSNDILIDFKGKLDFKKYKGLAKYIYYTDGSYNVVIKLPNKYNYPYYYFPVIITPSTKPICTISYKEISNNKYYFTIKGEKSEAPIAYYRYKLKNITNGNTLKVGKGSSYRTRLSNGSDYQLYATVVDSKGKKGTCKSDIINLSNRINYKFKVLLNGKVLSGDEIKVAKLPFKYNFKITDITPNNSNLNVGFDIDNDGNIDEDGKEYEGKITKKENKKITFILKDNYGNTSIKEFNFIINLKPLIGDLEVKPTEGEAPLNVEFDASASEVVSTGDKIIYFNWDFDDGEVMKGTRQGIVDHVYQRPGKYIANVTIETKKGYKVVMKKQIDVWKPVNISKIIFPNNLGGQGGIGSPIKIMLKTSGNIKNIEWDFGDGKVYTCANRECLSISHIYEKKGRYKITAKVNYIDGSPTSTARASIYITSNEY